MQTKKPAVQVSQKQRNLSLSRGILWAKNGKGFFVPLFKKRCNVSYGPDIKSGIKKKYTKILEMLPWAHFGYFWSMCWTWASIPKGVSQNLTEMVLNEWQGYSQKPDIARNRHYRQTFKQNIESQDASSQRWSILAWNSHLWLWYTKKMPKFWTQNIGFRQENLKVVIKCEKWSVNVVLWKSH